MSISRHIDEYLAVKGIEECDEVVPESECQVFDGRVAKPSQELDHVREQVKGLLEG